MSKQTSWEGELHSDYPPPFSRRLLHPRLWATWFGLALFWLFSQLPAGLRHRLGAWLGGQMYRRNAKRREIIETNLEWCFPELDEGARRQRAAEYFRCFGETMTDYGQLWWGGERRLRSLVEVEGLEHLQCAREGERPVILLTNHHVALDYGAARLSLEVPIIGLIKEARNPLIDQVIARGRTRFRTTLFQRDKGIRPVVKAVRQGHVFYYLPDEDHGPEQSVFVPFFGVATATITALSRLCRMTGAAVVPFTTIYNPQTGRYLAYIGEPLEAFPGEDEVADAARMNRQLEGLIRQAPEQYMWSLRIFMSRPDGSLPPYRMKSHPGSGPRPRPTSPDQ